MIQLKRILLSRLEAGRFWICVLNSLYIGVVLVSQGPGVKGAAYDAIEYLPGTKTWFGAGCIVSAGMLVIGKRWSAMVLRVSHAAASGSWFIVGFYAVVAWASGGGSPSLLMGLFLTLAYLNYNAAVMTHALHVTGFKRE